MDRRTAEIVASLTIEGYADQAQEILASGDCGSLEEDLRLAGFDSLAELEASVVEEVDADYEDALSSDLDMAVAKFCGELALCVGSVEFSRSAAASADFNKFDEAVDSAAYGTKGFTAAKLVSLYKKLKPAERGTASGSLTKSYKMALARSKKSKSPQFAAGVKILMKAKQMIAKLVKEGAKKGKK